MGISDGMQSIADLVTSPVCFAYAGPATDNLRPCVEGARAVR